MTEKKYNEEGYVSPVLDQLDRDIARWKESKVRYTRDMTLKVVGIAIALSLIAYGVAGLTGFIR